MVKQEAEATFAEIRGLFPMLPAADDAARDKTVAREAGLAKPAGSLGRLEALTAWGGIRH